MNYTIEYKPGESNSNADALSRLIINNTQIDSLYDWVTAQENDPVLNKLRQYILTKSGDVTELTQFERLMDLLIIDHDRILKLKSVDKVRIVVPSQVRNQILELCHSNP